jgi:hypothetical protein
MGNTIILAKFHPDEFIEDIEKAECYQISLLGGPTGDQIFQEQHGWWDEKNQKAHALVTTIRPDERLSAEEARESYYRQITIRVSEGFVHSRSFDFNENKFVYRLITVKAHQA